MKFTRSLIAIITTASFSFPLFAADAQNEHQTLTRSINEYLLDKYVFPEIAPKYASKLNQCLADNCLSQAQDDQQVAEIITEQLQAVHQDKHLKVFSTQQKKGSKKRKRMMKMPSGEDSNNTGIAKQEILAGNIGYLKINMFPGSDASVKATHQALKSFKDTNAIIFDIREHRGGSPRDISEISNFLFQQPTHMVTTRSPHVNNGEPTPHMSEPNRYAQDYKDKPVYVLTSKKSGSAAEHFALSMKATGRAILVGETTGGWGHWGEIVKLNDQFSMFLPSGRTYHPVNKLGWEGIGITPDILTTSDESYDYALSHIKARI